jgi:hypothetical protein
MVDFWSSLGKHKLVSQSFSELAAKMAARVGGDSD